MGKSERDSDTDIRKYMPDLATILKRADPAYGERIFQEAVDNPELDEAIAERNRALAALDVETAKEAPAESTAIAGGAGAAAASRVSAPSPWAGGATDEVDPRALPSANAPKLEGPNAAPPVTSPVPRAKPHGRRAWPRRVYVLAAAIILSPVLMWIVVSRVPRQASELPASASATATAAPSASQATSAAPSASQATSASEPVKTAEPVIAPPSSTPVRPKPRNTAEDPYDAAPPPTPTVSAVPSVAPAPPVTAAPSVGAAAPPASSAPFLIRKKDP